MTLDFASLDALRTRHPAWRLLRSDHAPLVASFLNRVFVVPNVRVMAAVDLAEALEDELYVMRQHFGEDVFPKPALEYLNDWASAERGWLRKFYRQGTDEAQFDLTPSTEKAIAWLGQLAERSFIGTESRLLTVFELLKQMSAGSETDPDKRIAELTERREAIEAEIARIREGDLTLLDDTALKDRFQQFMQVARGPTCATGSSLRQANAGAQTTASTSTTPIRAASRAARKRSSPTPFAASLAYQFGLEWGAVRSRSFRFVVIDEAFGRGSDESAQYGLKLFQQLNLQLLIVTPLQKIHIIEPFVSSVGFVHNEGGRASKLRNLTIEEYQAQKAVYGLAQATVEPVG